MRRLFSTFLISILFGSSGMVWGENEKLLQLPPASLAQWYKPENKRQVWLHNMFKLRREMQAVSEYLALEDQARAAKWSDRLSQHYSKIGEMVPEWQDELELEQMDRLKKAVKAGDYQQAAGAMRKLGMSCRSCHREYRAVAAALYRTPDFSAVMVEDSETLEEESYEKLMQRLTLLVNRIKIASEDDRKPAAIEALADLRRRLNDLGEGCNSCHKDDAPRERILGAGPGKSFAALERGLDTGDKKAIARNLGTVAVLVCARCHGVHRTLYDVKQLVSP